MIVGVKSGAKDKTSMESNERGKPYVLNIAIWRE